MENEAKIAHMLRLEAQYKTNKQYAVFVDFSVTADNHRFFVIDLRSKQITYSWFTSHGSGSGQLKKAERFSNVPNSHCSSKGLMKIGKTYNGKFGLSRKLHGLEPENSNVYNRVIVLHSSWYVSHAHMKTVKYPGRSQGCITMAPEDKSYLLKILEEGTLLYVHA